MKYKAILFDLDGTLFDSIPIIMKSFREAFDLLGIDYDEAKVAKTIGIPLAAQAKLFAGERSEEFRERYRGIYRANQEKLARLYPNTAEMLGSLRAMGFATALVTSKASWATMHALELTGISDAFDVIVTATDVANHKPHPEPILRALELLEIDPSDALFVGDSFFDIESADAAEVDVVTVAWGACNHDELLPKCPLGVFDSWQGFLSWLAPE